jgi:hypothetical protein
VEATENQPRLKMSKISDQEYERIKEFKYPEIVLREDNEI